MLNTPILFIVFNRPDTTRQVFDAIRKAKPKQLFVAADGPRPDKEREQERCDEVRKIATAIDWDCELKTLFRIENIGCGRGPATAIDWFFENVEQGIILEDDCLPNQSFFMFCEELLNYYKDEKKIMHISGNNFQFGKKRGLGSYYFSKYTHNWGWATWRRAWSNYQFELFDLEKNWEKLQKDYNLTEDEKKYWWLVFSELINGKGDVWDGQWLYSVWKNGGVSILPNKNLIQNIGFGADATHTFQKDSLIASMQVQPIKKIKHPNNIVIDLLADQYGFRKIFLFETERNLFKRVIKRFNRVLKKI